MTSRSILGYTGAIALATGAAVIGQNQPANPSRPPASTQPSTAQPSQQPSANQPSRANDQNRWRDMADKIQHMNDSTAQRNQQLAQQLAQAQVQTGEARVNAIAEVLTGVLREQERTGRAITQLQRIVFRSSLDSANMSGEWDMWKQQYPFLDESKDIEDDSTTGTGTNADRDRKRDSTNPSGTTTPTPRNPR